jgi:cell division protein FtsB
MRPKPRSRRRGRPASRVHWDRLGRIALVIVLAAVLLSYINPVVNFLDAWGDARTERAQLDELSAENGKLRKRITALDEADAAEREARKLGMVAAGEASYVIRGLGDD